jgi:hypothetical protein
VCILLAFNPFSTPAADVPVGLQADAHTEVLDAWTEYVGYGETKMPLRAVKVRNTFSGREQTLRTDRDGRRLSGADLRALRDSAWQGKIHPLLRERFDRVPADRAPEPHRETVIVWLETEPPAPVWADRGPVGAAEDDGSSPVLQSRGLQAVEQAEQQALARRRQMAAAFETAGDRFIQAAGIDPLQVVYRYRYAPAVVLVLTMAECRALEQRADVNFLFAPQEMQDELDVISRECRATDVWDDNYIGSGVTIAHIEAYEVMATNNPYLEGSSFRDQQPPEYHATACAGIIKSIHATRRGVAHGCTLLHANRDIWGNPTNLHKEATEWAVDEGASILNMSAGMKATDDGEFDWSDIYYDYLVHYGGIFFTKSAGNYGSAAFNYVVTSPGRGYNSLTVGNVNGMHNVDWTDDVMRSSSCYTNPVSNTEKPEVAAYGSQVRTTSTNSPWTDNIGSGTSFAAPLVAGIGGVCIDKHPSFIGEPQALKAVIMVSAMAHNIEGAARLSDKDGAGCAMATAHKCGWRAVTLSNGSFDAEGYYELDAGVGLQDGIKKRVVMVYTHPPRSEDAVPDPTSYDKCDLDLYLYQDADDSSDAGSNYGAYNPFEIIDFTPTMTTNGRVKIKRWSWDGDVTNLRVAVAWASETSIGSAPGAAPSADDNYEGNDTMDAAYNLSAYPGCWLATLAGPGIQNDDDYYRIDVNAAMDQLVVTCKFAAADGDIDLRLYDSDSNSVAQSRSVTDCEGFVVDNLSDTTYFLRLFYDDAGNAYDLRWQAFDLAPAAPSNVTAGGYGCGKVQLEWLLSGGATGYRIFYDEDSFNPPYTPSNDGFPASGSSVGNVDNVNITGLTAGATYYFSVAATNAYGSSPYSPQDTATVGSSCPPDTPTDVTAIAGVGCGDLAVQWAPADGASNYRIFYEEGSGGPPYTPADDGVPSSGAPAGNVTNVVISGLSAGLTYYVSVKATNLYGESDYAAADHAAAGNDCDDAYEENDDRATATNLSEHTWLSSINGKGIQKDSDFYRITVSPDSYRRVVITCDFVHAQGDINMSLVNSTGTLETFVFTDTDNEVIDWVVPDMGTYYIHIYGVNAGNTYDLWWDDLRSPPFPATSPDPTHGKDGVSVTATVSWVDGGDADGYIVYFGTDPTPDVGEYKGPQPASTFDPGPLLYESDYYWRIDATNVYGTTTGAVWQFRTETLAEDHYEENDIRSQATNIAEQTWLSSLNGSGYQQDDDWYRLMVDPWTYRRIVVTCAFSQAEGNIDLALLNTTGGLMTCVCSATDNEVIDYTAPTGGAYYVRVYGVNAGTEYDLWWDDLAALPDPAVDPAPAHAATNVPVYADLSWTRGIDAQEFVVYFGTDFSPDDGELQGLQSGTAFDPGMLCCTTRYYWRIDPVGTHGINTGDVWYFTTMAPLDMQDASMHAATGLVLRWNSIEGMHYTVARSTNLPSGFTGVASNIAATPPQNTYTGSLSETGLRVYRVELQQE